MAKSFKTLLLTSDEGFQQSLAWMAADDERFYEGLEKESDRGAALIAGAYFETLLGRCLSVMFLEATSTNELLSQSGGLGTFSGRLSCCRGLRIISDRQYRALKLLSRIRNKFAHDFFVSFESPWMIDRVGEFAMAVFPTEREATGFIEKGARVAFIWGCTAQGVDLQWRPLEVANFVKDFDDVIPFEIRHFDPEADE